MMIESKIILDSVNPAGVRLTTVSVTMPRFILAELNTHRSFCIGGDAILEFDLPAGSRGSKHRIHSMTLRDFYDKWENGTKPRKNNQRRDIPFLAADEYTMRELADLLGYASASNLNQACRDGHLTATRAEDGRTWKASADDIKAYFNRPEENRQPIRERLKKMKIRQLDESTGRIRHSTVKNAVFSGVKDVFRITTEDGNEVKATKDHRFFTPDGWKRLEDISIGEEVFVKGFTVESKRDSARLRKPGGRYRNAWQKRIFPDLVSMQNGKCLYCTSEPKEVHHIKAVNEYPELAFDLDNVVAVCKACHKLQHKKQGWQVSNELRAKSVKVVGIEPAGKMDTYDLEIDGEFPNFLANGFVVHNSRSTASSRAVPIQRMIERVAETPAMPVHWGANQAGMQAHAEVDDKDAAIAAWLTARDSAIQHAHHLNELGLHKQIVNRVLEPFMEVQTLITATDWQNFFELRDHPDAQPEIQAVARAIRAAMDASRPKLMQEREWHIPYLTDADKELDIPTKIKVSVARCARTSYFYHDGKRPPIEKDLELYERLVGSKPQHMSPAEHVAMAWATNRRFRNLDGWMQWRIFVEGEA